MNQLQIFDRIKFTGGANALANLTYSGLAGQPAGFDRPADTAAAAGEWWPFLIHDETTDDWEIGLYQETGGSNEEWVRGGSQVVLASSNAGAAVAFTNGNDLTVSLVDPALLVESPQRLVDVTSGAIDRTGSLLSHNGATTRFPLVSDAYTGHVDGLAAEVPSGSHQAHVERVATTLTTSDATPTEAFVFEMPSTVGNTCAIVEATIIASKGGFGGSHKVMTLKGCAHEVGGGGHTSLGSTTLTVVADPDTLAATADTYFAGGLVLEVTGEAATDYVWAVNATVTYLEG